MFPSKPLGSIVYGLWSSPDNVFSIRYIRYLGCGLKEVSISTHPVDVINTILVKLKENAVQAVRHLVFFYPPPPSVIALSCNLRHFCDVAQIHLNPFSLLIICRKPRFPSFEIQPSVLRWESAPLKHTFQKTT